MESSGTDKIQETDRNSTPHSKDQNKTEIGFKVENLGQPIPF